MKSYLAVHAPQLRPVQRFVVRAALPGILRDGEAYMLRPPSSLVRRHRIPKHVLASAYGPGSPHAAKMRDITASFWDLVTPKGLLAGHEHG